MQLRDYTLVHASTKARGIFCLETDWSEVGKSPSVEPMLELLRRSPLAIPFVHRNVVTVDALDHYTKKWSQRSHAKYPILYLAFHGVQGEGQMGDPRRKGARVSLDSLEDALRGRCDGRIIHFGCCQTLGVSQRRLRQFIDETGCARRHGLREGHRLGPLDLPRLLALHRDPAEHDDAHGDARGAAPAPHAARTRDPRAQLPVRAAASAQLSPVARALSPPCAGARHHRAARPSRADWPRSFRASAASRGAAPSTSTAAPPP